ncbi:hypothetical protein [Streptomyces sp. NPDC059092]
MDNDISAGSTNSASILGQLAPGPVPLACGIGLSGVVDRVTATR